MTEVADPRGLSFRSSAIAFALMTLAVMVLAAGLLILLDPRAQAFWGGKLSDLGSAAHALLQTIRSLVPLPR
ncbi:MAG TPA: hypothetical protein VHG53_03850 [Candidatus Limnocylindria bacterium]|nr:hypothetical protein [Candidatus Limnocylindria bacterium]